MKRNAHAGNYVHYPNHTSIDHRRRTDFLSGYRGINGLVLQEADLKKAPRHENRFKMKRNTIYAARGCAGAEFVARIPLAIKEFIMRIGVRYWDQGMNFQGLKALTPVR